MVRLEARPIRSQPCAPPQRAAFRTGRALGVSVLGVMTRVISATLSATPGPRESGSHDTRSEVPPLLPSLLFRGKTVCQPLQ